MGIREDVLEFRQGKGYHKPRVRGVQGGGWNSRKRPGCRKASERTKMQGKRTGKVRTGKKKRIESFLGYEDYLKGWKESRKRVYRRSGGFYGNVRGRSESEGERKKNVAGGKEGQHKGVKSLTTR